MVVVITHKFNVASFFPEAGNLNSSNADMCSDVARPSISGSGSIYLSFQIHHKFRTFTIPPTTSTTGRHLGFERENNYQNAFRACYVIMHKVYITCDINAGIATHSKQTVALKMC